MGRRRMASRGQVAGGARAVLAAFLVAVLVLSLITLFTRSVQNRAGTVALDQRVSERLDNQRSTIDEQDGKLALLEAQLEALGEEPVVRSDTPGRPTIVTLPPAEAALLAAVEAYCAVDGACTEEPLPPLPPADPLPPLPPIVIPGEKGDTGNTGATGPQGARGPDGRGVSRFDCVDGLVRVTYTDNTTQTVTSWSCSPPESSPPDDAEPTPEESP